MKRTTQHSISEDEFVSLNAKKHKTANVILSILIKQLNHGKIKSLYIYKIATCSFCIFYCIIMFGARALTPYKPNLPA